ncbi:MAG: DUF4093 domain-containing protein [Oscillospiraceae bacterium]|nr:DUF4093 domain-containing protein [Oscillospiraceae bacterium]
MGIGKPCIEEIIIVEGKYDKAALSQVVNATVVTTDGFAVFKNKGLRNLLHRLAHERGVIILTDSDDAGMVIRNYLTGALPRETVRHAYIPELQGREARKKSSSRAGLIGVEGMHPEILLNALRSSGAIESGENTVRESISKADLYGWGLSGGVNSAKKRKMLQKKLDLPSNLSAKMLCQVLTILYGKAEIQEILEINEA